MTNIDQTNSSTAFQNHPDYQPQLHPTSSVQHMGKNGASFLVTTNPTNDLLQDKQNNFHPQYHPEDHEQQEAIAKGLLNNIQYHHSNINKRINNKENNSFANRQSHHNEQDDEPTTNNHNGPNSSGKAQKLCTMTGCKKRIRSRGLCKAHGGGKRCQAKGCEKSSQGRGFCIRHGGGKRCMDPSCSKSAQSNGLCKAHGGGLRCSVEGCNKSSQGGGYCRSHGGGQRCQEAGCEKGAQRGGFCAGHGGSRYCQHPKCVKNDRGGGFCAEHGGGRRCGEPNCSNPARKKGKCAHHAGLKKNHPAYNMSPFMKNSNEYHSTPPASAAVLSSVGMSSINNPSSSIQHRSLFSGNGVMESKFKRESSFQPIELNPNLNRYPSHLNYPSNGPSSIHLPSSHPYRTTMLNASREMDYSQMYNRHLNRASGPQDIENSNTSSYPSTTTPETQLRSFMDKSDKYNTNVDQQQHQPSSSLTDYSRSSYSRRLSPVHSGNLPHHSSSSVWPQSQTFNRIYHPEATPDMYAPSSGYFDSTSKTTLNSGSSNSVSSVPQRQESTANSYNSMQHQAFNYNSHSNFPSFNTESRSNGIADNLNYQQQVNMQSNRQVVQPPHGRNNPHLLI